MDSNHARSDEQAKGKRRGRGQIAAALAGAISRDEMRVLFQPQIRLSDGSVTGFEALARWHNPLLGEVEPERFIPVAEQENLIGEIGLWAIATALSQIAELNGPAGCRVAVNVSATQLIDPLFPERVARILAALSFPPHRLELEITESSFLLGEDTAATSVAALRQAGISVALDDFGAGYSNLAALARCEFDRLKLDRSLVGEIHTPRGERVVEWAVSMARALGLEVIAEGVETETQADRLRAVGCDHAQGFLYAQPLPAVALNAWLQSRKAA